MYELKDDDGYLLMENHEFNPYKVSVSKLKNMLKPKDHPDIFVLLPDERHMCTNIGCPHERCLPTAELQQGWPWLIAAIRVGMGRWCWGEAPPPQLK